MTVYLDLVVLLNFLVDTLLLMGTNRLTGFPPGVKRAALAGAAGGVYAGICMLPGWVFLGNLLWRAVFLCVLASIAFGWNRSAIRRCGIFVLLSMALGGIALGLEQGDFGTLILAAAAVAILCGMTVHSPLGMQKYQPVELKWNGQHLCLTALIDTGNTLRDPVTGASVLVVGADVAGKLGISREILHDPVTAIAAGKLPGARLIPYRAVGKTGALLPAVRLEEVRLGGQVISPIVAFAPEDIGRAEAYQALAGGLV